MLRLTQERIKRGWTKAQLAGKAGIHPTDLGKMENGTLRAYPGWKKKLARIFKMDAEELFAEVQDAA